ncbi:MAG: hypothetical protein HRU40_03450, partial [Saprospiraceae bacterium]|nr:hypothetical protein [Saprospiraceae bacterium]
MKKLYNNFLKTCTVILAFLIPSMGISQNFTLTVDMPGSVAGSYDVQLAGFGPTLCSVDALSGSFDIIVDGAGGTLAC